MRRCGVARLLMMARLRDERGARCARSYAHTTLMRLF